MMGAAAMPDPGAGPDEALVEKVARVTDGLTIQDRWAPSRRPYAFRLEEAVRDTTGWTVPALWSGRKAGRTTITLGSLHVFNLGLHEVLPVRAMLEVADLRYGGSWHMQWDGDTLLVEPQYRQPPGAHLLDAADMDGALRGLPKVPDGWSGWYYRRMPP